MILHRWVKRLRSGRHGRVAVAGIDEDGALASPRVPSADDWRRLSIGLREAMVERRRPRRYADLDRTMLLRAAKLARLPGVTRVEACERFDLSIGMLRRALRELWREACPSPRTIVLHAVTDAGTLPSGELPDLACVASYVDYVDKNGMTAAGVQAILDELVAEGVLAIDGERFRLLVEFP